MAIEKIVLPDVVTLASDPEENAVLVQPYSSIKVESGGEFERANKACMFVDGRWVIFWQNEWITNWMTTIVMHIPVTYVTYWNSVVPFERATTRVTQWNTSYTITYQTKWTESVRQCWTTKWTNGQTGPYTRTYWKNTCANRNVAKSRNTTKSGIRSTSKTVNYTTYWDVITPKSKLTSKVTVISTQIEAARWTKF